jgi:hypothetical protein
VTKLRTNIKQGEIIKRKKKDRKWQKEREISEQEIQGPCLPTGTNFNAILFPRLDLKFTEMCYLFLASGSISCFSELQLQTRKGDGVKYKQQAARITRRGINTRNIVLRVKLRSAQEFHTAGFLVSEDV